MSEASEAEPSAQLLTLLAGLNRADTVDAALAHALQALTRGLELDAAAVLLSDEARIPRCRAGRGLTDRTQRALEEAALTSGFESADSLVWRAAANQAEDALCALAAAETMASIGWVAIENAAGLVGHVVVFSRRARQRCDRDVALAGFIVAQLARSFEIAHVRASERRLVSAAEENADRMRRLGRVAAALSSVPTALDVCTLIVNEAHEALGADWSGIWLLDADATRLEVMASRGGPSEFRGCAIYPLDAENPLCLAVRSNESMWLETWQDFARRFPASEARVRSSPPVSFGCLPLRIDDKMIGGMVLTFFKQRSFSQDERSFMALFAQHCAQGIERARLYDQAMEAIRVRDDFLSVAGHELRTPLSTLLLQTQGLVDGRLDLPAHIHDRLAPVSRSLRRLIRLADDVLDVSRMRAGRLGLEPEELDLSAFVAELIARPAESWHRSKCDLRFTSQGPITGRWDPVRVEQIVVNLITNACKYGAGKPIEVRVSRCPEGAQIQVCDHGIGIAAADQPRIFERFERLEDRREYSGLGLGLWIVRELVRLHGGNISVRSEPGEGAEFSVVLPLTVPAQPRR